MRESGRPSPPAPPTPAGWALGLAVLALLICRPAGAAPVAGELSVRQPDGSFTTVIARGDEFHAHLQDAGGYLAVLDPQTGWMCYGRIDATGQDVVSTGVPLGARPPADLVPGAALSPDAAHRLAERRRRQLLGTADKGLLPHTPVTLGSVRGITLLIDFPDDAADDEEYTIADIEATLNEPGFSGFGNHGSVRDYFRDVSGGRLEYSNFVTPFFYRAPDSLWTYAAAVDGLVEQALVHLDATGFDFGEYDVDDDGIIDAINVLFVGYGVPGTALWPHFAEDIDLALDGVAARRYQITDLRSAPFIGTFCHETGHLLGAWPDLYDRQDPPFDSGGLGGFCLMSKGGFANAPVAPCLWLRLEAGWADPVVLDGHRTGLRLSTKYSEGYLIRHPDPEVSNDFYLIENRQPTGRDASLPDPGGGLAIYHVDTVREGNDVESHYLVHLVQADGLWELENGRYGYLGGDGDLWAAPEATGFDFQTTPAAFWWDDDVVGLHIANVSASGPSMTFDFESYRVRVDLAPHDLGAAWTLTGPGAFAFTGVDSREFLVPRAGAYTLAWQDLAGWGTPVPAIATGVVGLAGSTPAEFSGQYGSLLGVVTGGLGAGATVTSVNIVDHDGDGWPDVFVANRDSVNLLLRNDGGLTFTDVAASPLADAPDTRVAVWGDTDGDGDQDVFLGCGNDTCSHRLLERTADGFVDRTSLTPAFATLGAVSAASLADFNGDGSPDLHVVRPGEAADSFLAADSLVAQAFAAETGHFTQTVFHHTSARWGDLDRNGWPDLFVTAAGEPAVSQLAINVDGRLRFPPQGGYAMITTSQETDCTLADVDNDGRLDVVTLECHGLVRIFRQLPGGQWHAYVGASRSGTAESFTLADFDNDGRLDIYVAFSATDGDRGDLLALNLGDPDDDGEVEFREGAWLDPEFAAPHTAVAAADLDRDGDIDLFLGSAGGENCVVENRWTDRGNWLDVVLVGDGDNADALGARVTITSGGLDRLLEVQAGGGPAQNDRVLHFGVGNDETVDLRVDWDHSSAPTFLSGVPVNDRVLVRQADLVDPTGAGTTPPQTAFGAPHPNPFNPSTTLEFALTRPGPVTVAIYGLDGRRVAELMHDVLPAGPHAVTWHGRDAAGRLVASGSYLCRIVADGQIHVTRLTLVR